MRTTWTLAILLVFTFERIVFGYQSTQPQLTPGLGGILTGVAALLIAVGALVLFIKLGRVLDRIEKKFKED